MHERDNRKPESPWSGLDRLFDDWMRTQPMRRLGGEAAGEEIIRVDEYFEDDTQVIRAELPGIDPEKDVAVNVEDSMLTIEAERRVPVAKPSAPAESRKIPAARG